MESAIDNRRPSFRNLHRFANVAAVVAALLLPAFIASQSVRPPVYGEKVLYNFCSVTNCTDGSGPYAGLTSDEAGNFYGATLTGGAYDEGAVFKLTEAGKMTVLYSFTGKTDGAGPLASLVRDKEGNLYGTTNFGGDSSCDCGTVFKLNSTGELTVLYAFKGGTDGASPFGGVIRDNAGNIYGTTFYGGDANCYEYGCGTVFKLDTAGNETVLHRFTGAPDGENPYLGSLALDAKGNLYGTTWEGGTASNWGTVFRVSQSGKETVLHSFAGYPNDGENPYAGVILDKERNLYGTAASGGSSGAGVVFKLNNKGKETILYTFLGGTDGADPESSLIRDAEGNLYGTTWAGGYPGSGTVFKVLKNGAEVVLRKFSGAGGLSPIAGVLRNKAGNVYGTTFYGGEGSACNNEEGCGVVYELIPAKP
jgi:uncharacterized repeat protein (TIGR03803 family)